MIYTIHHCICTTYKHRPWNKTLYEKNVLNWGLIYVRYHKNIIGHNNFFLEILQESQVNSIVCVLTRILYMKNLSQNIKLFGIIVIYIFVQVNMMITSYFYMKLTGRFRWMTGTCHLCFLQHWKLYHVWKNVTILMMTVQIS